MTTTQPSPRRYSIGDTIPGHTGTVAEIGLTAYRMRGMVWGDAYWVPFYGPNGVDEQAPVEGLVSFADGSRYGGAR